jgi:hypothetical protein
VQSESATLTIEIPRPGWRPSSLGGVVFVAVWCAVWHHQTAGSSPVSFWVIAGYGAAIWTLAVVVDRVYTKWRLSVGPETVSVERKGLFLKRAWTCPRDAFSVGGEATVRQSSPASHREPFIDLRLSEKVVKFMRGHRERDLEAVRSRIVDFMGDV